MNSILQHKKVCIYLCYIIDHTWMLMICYELIDAINLVPFFCRYLFVFIQCLFSLNSFLPFCLFFFLHFLILLFFCFRCVFSMRNGSSTFCAVNRHVLWWFARCQPQLLICVWTYHTKTKFIGKDYGVMT